MAEEATKRPLPVVLALITAVSAIVGSFIGACVQGRQNLDLEREKGGQTLALETKKFENALIQKALATDNRGKAIEEILWYVGVGLVDDRDGKIAEAAKDPKIPVEARSQPSQSCEIRGVWTIRQPAFQELRVSFPDTLTRTPTAPKAGLRVTGFSVEPRAANGAISGNMIQLDITWENNNLGRYVGNITIVGPNRDRGVVRDGVTFNVDKTAETQRWEGEGPASCP